MPDFVFCVGVIVAAIGASLRQARGTGWARRPMARWVALVCRRLVAAMLPAGLSVTAAVFAWQGRTLYGEGAVVPRLLLAVTLVFASLSLLALVHPPAWLAAARLRDVDRPAPDQPLAGTGLDAWLERHDDVLSGSIIAAAFLGWWYFGLSPSLMTGGLAASWVHRARRSRKAATNSE